MKVILYVALYAVLMCWASMAISMEEAVILECNPDRIHVTWMTNDRTGSFNEVQAGSHSINDGRNCYQVFYEFVINGMSVKSEFHHGTDHKIVLIKH